MKEYAPSKLAGRIRHKIAESNTTGINQKRLAEIFATDQSTVSRLLNGKINKLPPKAIDRIAKFLLIEPEQVIEELRSRDSVAPIFELNSENVTNILHLVPDDLPIQIYIKDLNRRFVWVNKTMLAACNFTKLSDLVGLSDEDLFESPHREEATADDEMVLSGKTIPEKVEFETWKAKTAATSPEESKRPQRLRLVVTTKRPLIQNGIILGLIGFTKSLDLPIPGFLTKLGNRWNFGGFTGGIYYQSKSSGHIWCDETFAGNFPGKKHTRWRRICPPDRPRVKSFFKQLEYLPQIGTEGVTATIDFRANVRGKTQWFRGTGIAFGNVGERTFICGLQIITEEMASSNLASRVFDSFPTNSFIFIEDEKQRFCYINEAFQNVLGIQLSQAVGKTFGDLGIHKVISSSMMKKKPAAEEKEMPAAHEKDWLPIVDYEEVETKIKSGTRKEQKLMLMTIRIPIKSNEFPVWGSSYKSTSNTNSQRGHHTLGIAWDISAGENLFFDELARSAWAKLLDSSEDAVYIKEAASRKYISYNKAFADRFEMKDLIGKTADDLFVDEPELAKTIRDEDNSLVTGNLGVTHAFRKRPGSNGEFWFESSSKIAVSNSSGKVEFILGISRDISKQMKRLNE